MKWNKKEDTFTLARKELADVLDFIDFINFMKKKDQPVGWNEFKKEIYIPLNRLIGEYTKDLRGKNNVK